MDEEAKKIDKRKIQDILLILLPMFMAIAIEIFFKLSNGGITSVHFTSICFSIFLVYLIYAFFLSITKKNSIAITIVTIISYILLIVNQVKIKYVGEPFIFSDLTLIERVGDIADLTFSTIITMICPYIIGFIIIGILFFIMVKCAKKVERIIDSTKIRITMFVISSILLLLLFIPNKYTKEFYLELIFQANEHTDYNSYTTNLQYYQTYTMLSGMWGVMLNNNFTEPDNYDEAQLEEILSNVDIEQNDWRTT